MEAFAICAIYLYFTSTSRVYMGYMQGCHTVRKSQEKKFLKKSQEKLENLTKFKKSQILSV